MQHKYWRVLLDWNLKAFYIFSLYELVILNKVCNRFLSPFQLLLLSLPLLLLLLLLFRCYWHHCYFCCWSSSCCFGLGIERNTQRVNHEFWRRVLARSIENLDSRLFQFVPPQTGKTHMDQPLRHQRPINECQPACFARLNPVGVHLMAEKFRFRFWIHTKSQQSYGYTCIF